MDKKLENVEEEMVEKGKDEKVVEKVEEEMTEVGQEKEVEKGEEKKEPKREVEDKTPSTKRRKWRADILPRASCRLACS